MDIRIISGRLGIDAEKITIAEAPYLKAPIAVDNFGNTTWLDIILPDRGQKRNQYLTAGRAIEAWGRSTVRTYTDREGKPAARETLWVDGWRMGETNWPETDQKKGKPQLAEPVGDTQEEKKDVPTDLPF